MRKIAIYTTMLLLSGCASINANSLTTQDLMHRNFVLTNYNNQTIQVNGMSPGIEFGQHFYVTIKMCNEYSGFGELKADRLFVLRMIQTNQLCNDETLLKAEKTLSRFLSLGSNISFDQQKQQLIIIAGPDKFMFKAKDWVY